jgi:hypothetical protein
MNPDILGTEAATTVARTVALALLLALAACQATTPAPRGPDMPQATGAGQYEPGFHAFCLANPAEPACHLGR